MKKVKKWWIALLLGALLVAILVGVAAARPMRQTTYKLTIPGAHFHPRQDGFDWYSSGESITVNSGSGNFYAALPIALPGRFTVEKLTLFAYDNNNTYNIEAALYRVNPWTGSEDWMGEASTSGQSSTMQMPSTTSFSPDTIYGGHGAYIDLEIPSSSALLAYAVQIEYH